MKALFDQFVDLLSKMDRDRQEYAELILKIKINAMQLISLWESAPDVSSQSPFFLNALISSKYSGNEVDLDNILLLATETELKFSMEKLEISESEYPLLLRNIEAKSHILRAIGDLFYSLFLYFTLI